ncbi:agmatinase [Candidatus Micrarchaeota archaeon]|nr:agmatinase [Candidatus Micrarchaeota archaeon]
MELFHSLPYTFLGMEKSKDAFESAKVVLLPVPYDGTQYPYKGAANGARAIIEASRHIETFDDELNLELEDLGIYTLDELEISLESALETIKRVQEAVEEILDNKKMPIILGGEHSISLGAVRAINAKMENVSVLQLDAHADLRNEFKGCKYAHTCVMRRINEISHYVGVGIRSMSKEEKEFIEENELDIYGTNFNSNEILEKLKDKVYITIDLDVFDPSIIPSVGNPEPQGLFWIEILELLKKIAQEKEIIGFDIVELSPNSNKISDIYAAKLICKILSFSFFSKF